MLQYQLDSTAEIDLRDAVNYYAASSPERAAKVLARMRKVFRLLASHPEIGELCNFIAPDVRMFTVYKHVLFYRQVGKYLVILRIIHGSRDWQSILENP